MITTEVPELTSPRNQDLLSIYPYLISPNMPLLPRLPEIATNPQHAFGNDNVEIPTYWSIKSNQTFVIEEGLG